MHYLNNAFTISDQLCENPPCSCILHIFNVLIVQPIFDFFVPK